MQKNLRHLAIIMDGNRRWAHSHGFEAVSYTHLTLPTSDLV